MSITAFSTQTVYILHHYYLGKCSLDSGPVNILSGVTEKLALIGDRPNRAYNT